MKTFIKAVVNEIICILCRVLKLGIAVSLVTIGTIVENMVALMHYVHVGVSWFTIWVLRKIVNQEKGCDYDPDLERRIARITSRYARCYNTAIEAFNMIAENETVIEVSKGDEEA